MKRLLRTTLLVTVSLFMVAYATTAAQAAKPKKISVAYCVDCVQFHFKNDQGHADGLIIDLWRLWSKKTGIEIDFKPASWEETLRMVGAGEADVHAGLFFNDERNKFLEYGTSLTETDTHFFVHKSISGIQSVDELKDVKVGVLSGDYVEGYLKERLPPTNIIGFESYEAIISALENGQLKAFAADTPTGLFHLQKAGLGFDFEFPADKPLYRNSWFTAATKGNKELIGVINEGMALITQKEKDAIERRWSLIIVQKASEADAEGVRPGLNLSLEESEWLAGHQTIRVHNETDWPPFNFFESGRPQGFSIDYMKLLAETLGIKIEFVTGPTWDQFLGMMKSGELDVMLNIVRTPDRLKYMHYTRPFTSNPNAILSRKDEPYQQLEQLVGKTVAVTRGFFQEEILRRDFPGVNLFLGANATETMKAVAFGKADAALGELSVLNHLMSREMMTGLIVSGELKLGDPEYSKLNIAVRKDWPLLASIFEKGMDALDPNKVELLRQKWIGGSDDTKRQVLQLTDEEWAWIYEHKHMRLGVDALYPPFEFVDENGEFSGMASDYVRLISERLGITMEVISGLPWLDVLDGVENREIDVLPSISATAEREPHMNFTRPHIAFPLVIVTREDHPFVSGLENFKGKKVALMTGYGATSLVKAKHPAIKRAMFEGPLQALQSVAVGDADATVLNLAVATYLIKKHNINNLKVAASANIELPGLSFGVREDWPEFIGILNKALASITSEEESAIRSKWAGVQYEQGIDTGLIFQIGAGAVIILLVIVVWNRQLRHEVVQRKIVEKALRESEEQTRSAFETSTAGMFMHNGAGVFFKVNKTFCVLLGYSEDELLGMNWREVTHPEDLESTEIEDTSMVSGGVDNFVLEKRYTRKDGEHIWGRLFTSCVRKEDGSVDYIFCQVYDITDRKRAEAELAEKQAQLRTVMDNVPGGIRYIDKDMNYVLFNDKYLELYDFPEGLLKIGEHYRIENQYQAERGDFGAGDAADLTETWLDGKPLDTEPLSWERTTVHGKTLQVNTAPVPTGGVVNIVTDITERKHAEQLMTEAREHADAAEALVNDAVESISDAFVLYDADDRLVNCNSKFMELYNYTDDECHPGMTWMDLEALDTHRGTIVRESESSVPQGQRRWDDFERLLADGRWIDIRQRKTTSGGIVSIQVDITDRIHAEEMMKEAKEQAEQIADAKSEFIAVVSHEVRTPMNGVLGMARLLTETKLDDEQDEFVNTILASGESLITIINDLLDISKLDANKLEVESRAFSAQEVVEQSMALMQSRAREKELKFNKYIDPKMPDFLIGDPHRLRQVLLNLVGNAIKFTDEGSVSLEAVVEKITDQSAVLTFSVIDTGKGIAPETLKNLFSAYNQGSVEVARKYGGTGLGLAICRRLAALMDGEISVTSTVDEGSIFQFKASFGLAKDIDTTLKMQDNGVENSTTEPKQASRKLRILQVEDNAINRSVVERVLTKVGHSVSNAENGQVALNILQSEKFDAILMDRHMPVLDGLEATRRIRKSDGSLSAIPIIGITAGASKVDIQACLDSGMDQCLTKPVDAKRLRSILENLSINRSAAAGSPVLVVDDVEINRAVAKAQLRKLSYPFELVESGEEALSRIKSEEFSLVLLDVTMPGMDGIQCTAKIREWEEENDKRTPVIALTGNVTPQDRDLYLNSGMDDVLTKPLEIDELKAILERWGPFVQPDKPEPATEATQTAALDEPVAPIDLERLARTLGEDDEDELFFMLGIFNDEFPKLLDNLDKAIGQQDARAVHDCAHAAKGAAANAAAPAMTELMKSIEQDAHGEEWEDLKIRTGVAKTEYSRILQFCNDRT
jgi:PAS domain S-box-containing protein